MSSYELDQGQDLSDIYPDPSEKDLPESLLPAAKSLRSK